MDGATRRDVGHIMMMCRPDGVQFAWSVRAAFTGGSLSYGIATTMELAQQEATASARRTLTALLTELRGGLTKVHRVTLIVVDHDDLGATQVAEVLEGANYSNDCVRPSVVAVETRETEWSDDHPLNQDGADKLEIFQGLASPSFIPEDIS